MSKTTDILMFIGGILAIIGFIMMWIIPFILQDLIYFMYGLGLMFIGGMVWILARTFYFAEVCENNIK